MRISDWSSDVCSSDLLGGHGSGFRGDEVVARAFEQLGEHAALFFAHAGQRTLAHAFAALIDVLPDRQAGFGQVDVERAAIRGSAVRATRPLASLRSSRPVTEIV